MYIYKTKYDEDLKANIKFMSQENICLALQLKWTLNDTTSVPKTSPGKLNSILLTSLRNDTRFF